ncbi:MAG: hypothetical protein KF716_00445 [Anaerolineae bacterium]|nr:hypothetical protein [Anaerolineae bacterium]
MADVFLMGTAGSYNDPNRSLWREPIKEGLKKLGVSYYDPVVPTWTDDTMMRESEAMATAKMLVMAITSTTAGVASLAESGWLIASAIMRKQVVGIWVDGMFEGLKLTQGTMMIRREMMLKMGPETLEDASRRARKLVNSHARKLLEEYPDLKLYVAKDLPDLTDWTLRMAQELIVKPKKRFGLF